MINLDSNTINWQGKKPKYHQIVDFIIKQIDNGTLQRDEQLPSIAELSLKKGVAKVTVAKAYDLLKKKGIIYSLHGKGFFIKQTSVEHQLNVFVLFDTLNAYKEVLYRSFKNSLPEDTQISIYFHNYDIKLFENLIINNIGNFNYYVIMPHFDVDVSSIVDKIPAQQLIILDKDVPLSQNNFTAIYQDFDHDLYNGLKTCLKLLRDYQQINIIIGLDRFQYVPSAIITSFTNFCSDYAFPYRIYDTLKEATITKNEVYIIFSDGDMIDLIKNIQTKKWKLGIDIGLISYDETPLKEILMGGITVATTDFELMGKSAAQYILQKIIKRTAIPFKLIVRNSL